MISLPHGATQETWQFMSVRKQGFDGSSFFHLQVFRLDLPRGGPGSCLGTGQEREAAVQPRDVWRQWSVLWHLPQGQPDDVGEPFAGSAHLHE